MNEETESPEKPPTLFRNYISFVGGVIAAGSLASIVLLLLVGLVRTAGNLYRDLVTFILLPTFLILGIVILLIGVILERRRRRLRPNSEIMRFPKVDLNDPRQRRIAVTLVGISFVFVFMSAFGSYRAYEYSESVEFCGKTCHSVMKPEHVAYLASAHARVRCVDCHVGEGAGWYVKSKLSGAYQLYSVAFNKFSRPITTPVHNLRPAPDTCEQCHWPEKFFGAQLKTFNRYGYDEKNTLRQTRMLINVGGGSPTTGQVAGIHWHMNIGNEVTYISTDNQRQVIPWVQIKDRKGNVSEYYDRNRPLSPEQIEVASKRRMDCVDCHNRPAHVYLPPDVAVDQAFAAGKLDPSLPYLKRQAIAALSQTYTTEDEAVKAIATSLDTFYRTNSEVYGQKADAVKGAISETQRIYKTYFFPEMKTNWETHPNNIGHLYSSGCFRCHDGEHVSSSGKVISNDCNVCHTVIFDSARPPAENARTGSFKHPVDLGGLADRKCETCHKANAPFKHPVNLGDISMFQCVDCHPKSP